MHNAWKPTARTLAMACLAWVTGCTSSAQVEALRTQVEETNATAARAAVDAARAKRELAELKQTIAEAEARDAETASNTAAQRRSGYKWNELNPCSRSEPEAVHLPGAIQQ